jgi:hypothetical protein
MVFASTPRRLVRSFVRTHVRTHARGANPHANEPRGISGIEDVWQILFEGPNVIGFYARELRGEIFESASAGCRSF